MNYDEGAIMDKRQVTFDNSAGSWKKLFLAIVQEKVKSLHTEFLTMRKNFLQCWKS